MCATYSPTKPIAISVAPEKIMLRQTIDVQPGTVRFSTVAANTLYAAYPKPEAATKNPRKTPNRSGNAEKDVYFAECPLGFHAEPADVPLIGNIASYARNIKAFI